MTFDIQQAVEEANHDYFQQQLEQERRERLEIFQQQEEQERRERLEIILTKCSTVLDNDEMSQLRYECGA